MLGRRAATAADDPSAGVERQARIPRHQLGRSVEAQRAIDVLRDPAIRLGNENRGGIRGGGEIEDGRHQFRGADAAIAAARGEMVLAVQAREFGGRNAHHRSPVRIETQRCHHRQAAGAGARDGRFGFLDGRHRFDPQKVGAAARECGGLLGKGIARIIDTQGTERLEDLSGGADAPADERHPSGSVGLCAGNLSRLLVEFPDAVRRLV
jgi:hypothetical protein